MNNLSDPEEILCNIEKIINEEYAKYSESTSDIDDPYKSKDCPFSRNEIKDALQSNEVGDAALFIKMFRGKFVYDHAAGVWYCWNGQYWELDKRSTALALFMRWQRFTD